MGWIEFYIFDRVIKTNLWFTSQKKVTHNSKNWNYKYVGKFADVSFTHRKSNPEIRNDIKDFLLSCKTGEYSARFRKYSRNFFIDDKQFLFTLEFLDIKGLIEKNITDRV
jgi:hypothetical protein